MTVLGHVARISVLALVVFLPILGRASTGKKNAGMGDTDGKFGGAVDDVSQVQSIIDEKCLEFDSYVREIETAYRCLVASPHLEDLDSEISVESGSELEGIRNPIMAIQPSVSAAIESLQIMKNELRSMHFPEKSSSSSNQSSRDILDDSSIHGWQYWELVGDLKLSVEELQRYNRHLKKENHPLHKYITKKGLLQHQNISNFIKECESASQDLILQLDFASEPSMTPHILSAMTDYVEAISSLVGTHSRIFGC